MKTMLKETGKGALAIVALVATMVLMALVEEAMGFYWTDYTATKVLMQTILISIEFAVLWFLHARVTTTISTNTFFFVLFWAIAEGHTGISPWISILMLLEIAPIYLREKQNYTEERSCNVCRERNTMECSNSAARWETEGGE